MNTTIFKYVLRPGTEQDITMSYGAEILTAQAQHENICIWALVNPGEASQSSRRIVVLATGEPTELQSLKYISTVQLIIEGSSLVFHVFERQATILGILEN